MTDEKQGESTPKESAPTPSAVSLAQLLVELPPGGRWDLTDKFLDHPGRVGHRLTIPVIRLHCDKPSCGSVRNFAPETDELFVGSGLNRAWLSFTCRDCTEGMRQFAFLFCHMGKGAGWASKVGELPSFGPPLPSRLLTLIGPDADYFRRGRRAESQGMGVGAYAYYRRVVENQKNRLLDEAIRVGTTLSVDPSILAALERAKGETQFKKAMEDVKDTIPDVLKIRGLNPFTLLHHALSRGIHEMTDAECLQVAGDIRVVLAELAERMSLALKNERELADAVTRLNQLRSGQSPRD